jgi:hypothetical protein
VGASDGAGTGQAISRRGFSRMLFGVAGLPLLDWPNSSGMLRPNEPDLFPFSVPAISYPVYDEAVSRVTPAKGFQSRIALKDSVLKLVENGVIDAGKFFGLYGMSGPHPKEFATILSEPSDREILLTADNATYYVNLLWPIGLATRMDANAESPLNGDSLFKFASTGGWTLGREPNGGAYFNKLSIVSLTKSEEARVVDIAKATYRPCCNNSTFFQDCNHGSALLGVLQLGASQGLSEDELYGEALAFNSFWFPDYYIQTALFFKVIKKTEWPDVDPRVVLGFDYSAGGPWQQNVAAQVNAIRGLIPPAPGGGANCGA